MRRGVSGVGEHVLKWVDVLTQSRLARVPLQSTPGSFVAVGIEFRLG
jgi:hypothetical protein